VYGRGRWSTLSLPFGIPESSPDPGAPALLQFEKNVASRVSCPVPLAWQMRVWSVSRGRTSISHSIPSHFPSHVSQPFFPPPGSPLFCIADILIAFGQGSQCSCNCDCDCNVDDRDSEPFQRPNQKVRYDIQKNVHKNCKNKKKFQLVFQSFSYQPPTYPKKMFYKGLI